MAYGPEGITPDYSYTQSMGPKGNPNAGFLDKYGQHIIGAGLSALGGGLAANNLRQNMPQQQAPQMGQPGYNEYAWNQFKSNRGNGNPLTMSTTPYNEQKGDSTQQLSDLLSQLTSHKLTQMSGQQMQQPTQPNQLFQQATNVANQQTSNQQPPEWNSSQPGFSFDQFIGNNMNPLSALGDLGMGGSGESGEAQPDKSWLQKGANFLGQGLQAAAPLAGMLGPLGFLGGAAASGIGYGLQQI